MITNAYTLRDYDPGRYSVSLISASAQHARTLTNREVGPQSIDVQAFLAYQPGPIHMISIGPFAYDGRRIRANERAILVDGGIAEEDYAAVDLSTGIDGAAQAARGQGVGRRGVRWPT